MRQQSTALACRCGQVTAEVRGKPIASVECLCSDCRKAGTLLESLPGAPAVVDAHGATRLVLYRMDRVEFRTGRSLLREHRLSAHTPTRRVIASCCNTPMFVDFTKGHWLSLFGALWPAADLPALEVRVMTRSRPAGVALPDDVPNAPKFTAGLFARLLRAWAPMRFRVPSIDFVDGSVDTADGGDAAAPRAE